MFYPPPVDTSQFATQAGLQAIIDQITTLSGQVPSFVSSTPMTVANLLTTYPADASRLGKYARVTDLYGAADEVMRCSSNGTSYYWRPQRTDYAVQNASTGGTMTLTPLVTPPQLFLTGTLTSSMTITPSATNAWPGATFEVTAPGLIGALLGINLTGLVGGVVSLLAGSTRLLVYTAQGWRAA